MWRRSRTRATLVAVRSTLPATPTEPFLRSVAALAQVLAQVLARALVCIVLLPKQTRLGTGLKATRISDAP